ncbi:translation initiation factor IF-6 [Aeropyrum camini]|uniref:Translation initiation factor 6 n=1 Tax=Aeropyrum camini SY1 = JCM 12091 TaxID=1198449 RepID=U3TDS8_9CREN|nr:translation initiation factor IF-6 [Aeropyrum camini]BAN90170.1 translation initiation factor 6 eIF-6 [Aeropyrum camini SY1 = JCM 12091]
MDSGGGFTVEKLSLYGNPNIGVYLSASDSYVLAPDDIGVEDVRTISEVLRVAEERVVRLRVLGMRLVGVLTTGNSRGILLPEGVDREVELVKKALGEVEIGIVPTRSNALGNVIVCNDRACLASPGLEKEALKTVSDTLGVEVVEGSVAGVYTVGSAVVVTNRGGLAHPDASEEELKLLSDVFKVPFEAGTINFGVEFVRTGLVANSYGALVGEDTTGPEIARIQVALGGGVK